MAASSEEVFSECRTLKAVAWSDPRFELLTAGRLVRLNIQEAENPYRQRFTFAETSGSDDWRCVASVFVFGEPVDFARKYVIERADDPERSRLRWSEKKSPQSRDVAAWREVGVFYAYPERMQGCEPLSVDWTSTPDRYKIIFDEQRPEASWLRCFRFFAYRATKYHFLRHRTEEAYKLLENCPPYYKCLLSFFAFDGPVPNTNRYVAQSTEDPPKARLRLGMTKSEESHWTEELSFFAFDVPIAGTARLSVQYRTRDAKDKGCEQNRITVDDTVGGGPWKHKFTLFVFPAPDLPPS